MPPIHPVHCPARRNLRDPRGTRRRAILGACLMLWLAALPAAALAKSPAKGPAVENRCGWFDNPSPGNAWLTDRDGEWTIAIQGDHQAEGDWPPPRVDKEWVPAGGEGDPRGYGYGCACMKVETDRAQMRIVRIVSSQGKPLSQCRRDRKLTEPRD